MRDPCSRKCNSTSAKSSLTVLYRADASCASFHARVDPSGFALESFDVIGGFRERYRSRDKQGEATPRASIDRKIPIRFTLGKKVDASGKFSNGQEFSDFRQFKEIIASDTHILLQNLPYQMLVYSTGSDFRLRQSEQLPAHEPLRFNSSAAWYRDKYVLNSPRDNERFENALTISEGPPISASATHQDLCHTNSGSNLRLKNPPQKHSTAFSPQLHIEHKDRVQGVRCPALVCLPNGVRRSAAALKRDSSTGCSDGIQTIVTRQDRWLVAHACNVGRQAEIGIQRCVPFHNFSRVGRHAAHDRR